MKTGFIIRNHDEAFENSLFFFSIECTICFSLSWYQLIGAGAIALPSGTAEFTLGFKWGSCYSIYRCMCMFCRLLFLLLLVCAPIYGFWLPLWYLQTLPGVCGGGGVIMVIILNMIKDIFNWYVYHNQLITRASKSCTNCFLSLWYHDWLID